MVQSYPVCNRMELLLYEIIPTNHKTPQAYVSLFEKFLFERQMPQLCAFLSREDQASVVISFPDLVDFDPELANRKLEALGLIKLPPKVKAGMHSKTWRWYKT